MLGLGVIPALSFVVGPEPWLLIGPNSFDARHVWLQGQLFLFAAAFRLQ